MIGTINILHVQIFFEIRLKTFVVLHLCRLGLKTPVRYLFI